MYNIYCLVTPNPGVYIKQTRTEIKIIQFRKLSGFYLFSDICSQTDEKRSSCKSVLYRCSTRSLISCVRPWFQNCVPI